MDICDSADSMVEVELKNNDEKIAKLTFHYKILSKNKKKPEPTEKTNDSVEQ